MQSPASSGLLPASYSRRRRRSNEPLAEPGTSNGGSASYYNRGSIDLPTYGDSGGSDNTTGLSPRRSPSSRKPLYTLVSYDENKSSDDAENDENDRHHGNVRIDAYEEGYEDVLEKPLKLSDFLINDRCYQRNLLEGKRGSYRGIGSKNRRSGSSDKGFMDPSFLAKVCAGASFVGMLFLIFVAILMETQPLFIKGVSVKSTSGDDGTYRFRKETSNALKAAAAYFLTMVFSLIYLQAMDMNIELNPAIGRICHLRRMIVSTYFRYRRRHYDDIPDGHDSFGGASGSILPMHSNGEDKMLKSRRRRKRRSQHKDGDDSDGSAMEGVLGKIKSWGIGGGSSKTGKKKDK